MITMIENNPKMRHAIVWMLSGIISLFILSGVLMLLVVVA